MGIFIQKSSGEIQKNVYKWAELNLGSSEKVDWRSTPQASARLSSSASPPPSAP